VRAQQQVEKKQDVRLAFSSHGQIRFPVPLCVPAVLHADRSKNLPQDAGITSLRTAQLNHHKTTRIKASFCLQIL
jgi:hypothetical protein